MAVLVFLYPLFAACAEPVAFLGVSYAGQASTINGRFPYVAAADGFNSQLIAAGRSGNRLTAQIRNLMKVTQPRHFHIINAFQNLAGSNEAVALTLMISNEAVTEAAYVINGTTLHKLLVEVDAQAIFFDLKRGILITDYPLRYARSNVFDHEPTSSDIATSMHELLYGGSGKRGLLREFVATVAKAPYPKPARRYFQVKHVAIASNVGIVFHLRTPSALKSEKAYLANSFAAAMFRHAGIAFVPYVKDYLVGAVLPLSVDDGTYYDMKLPTPDYAFSLRLDAAKRIEYGANNVGKSYIYGVLMDVGLVQPLSKAVYLNSEFKNGVVVKVPASETSGVVQRFAYRDSINSLFAHLDAAIDGDDENWVVVAASSSEIKSQLRKTRELFASCKPAN